VAELIQKKLSNPSARMSMKKERVAEILERDAEPTIRDWMSKLERNEELSGVALSYQDRTGHLPLLLGDLVRRLRLAPNTKPPHSTAAREHGIRRRKQGYTVAMAAEESRILQVSVFKV
jgi:DNA-binding transcriptional ArsR family regulator